MRTSNEKQRPHGNPRVARAHNISAGDRLEPDYNMENNPLYEMRSLSNDTQAPALPVYETIDSVTV